MAVRLSSASARRLGALAETANVHISPHNPSGPVAMAATAHAAVTMPSFSILGYAFGEADWRERLIEPAESIQDGFYQVSDAPGLGVRLDETTNAAHAAL